MVGAHERNTHVSIAVARGGLVSNGATAILYQFERCAHLIIVFPIIADQA
jgi:hypothetical protein